MISKLSKIRSFIIEEDGTTAVEYAVMLALIIVACLGALVTFGDESGGLWNGTRDKIELFFNN